MKKRKLRAKVHNAVLWVATYSAFILFLLSLASMDSDSWIPGVVMIMSLVWLVLVALANYDRW